MCGRSIVRFGERGNSLFQEGIRGLWVELNPRMDNSTDSELLLKAASGNTAAFSDLYDRLSPVLFPLAMNMLRDVEQAEDLLQDVFLLIWDRANHYDPKLGTPLAWSVALTRNKAIDRIRANQRRRRLAEELLEEQGGVMESPAELGISGGETSQAVRKALQSLPKEQREAIELAFFKGLAHAEVAEALQAPLGTVKARIRRGMLQLREDLKDYL